MTAWSLRAAVLSLAMPLALAVYEKAKEPRELHVIEGATHIDMYDRPQFGTPAVAKLSGFFGRHLAEAGGSK